LIFERIKTIIELSPKKNLKLLSVRLRRLSDFLRVAFLAAAGGEMRSNYLKYSAHHVSRITPAAAGASVFLTFLLYMLSCYWLFAKLYI